MKKITLLLLVFVAVLSSCKKDDPQQSNQDQFIGNYTGISNYTITTPGNNTTDNESVTRSITAGDENYKLKIHGLVSVTVDAIINGDSFSFGPVKYSESIYQYTLIGSGKIYDENKLTLDYTISSTINDAQFLLEASEVLNKQ